MVNCNSIPDDFVKWKCVKDFYKRLSEVPGDSGKYNGWYRSYSAISRIVIQICSHSCILTYHSPISTDEYHAATISSSPLHSRPYIECNELLFGMNCPFYASIQCDYNWKSLSCIYLLQHHDKSVYTSKATPTKVKDKPSSAVCFIRC